MKPLPPTFYALLTALLGGAVFRTTTLNTESRLVLIGGVLVRFAPAPSKASYRFVFAVV